MSYETAQKASDETMRLQKARKGFAELQAEEEAYLIEREKIEEERLAGIRQEIESATGLFDAISEKVTKRLSEYSKVFVSFTDGIQSTLERVDVVVKRTNEMQSRFDKLEQVMSDRYEKLQAFESELGEIDRQLREREKTVEKRNNEADEKVALAKQLADWANKGKRYTITRSKKK